MRVVAVLAVTLLVGAMVQSLVGLGLALVSSPVAALVAPELMPGLVIFLAALLPTLTLARDWRATDWGGLAWALPARVPGTVIGVLLVATVSRSAIGVGLAVMVLVSVALTLRTVRIPLTPTSLVTAGLISGVAGTATSVGGPPFAVLYQHQRSDEIRATLGFFFLAGATLSLVGLGLGGQLSTDELGLAVLLSPMLLVGSRLGSALRPRLPEHRVRYAVLVVCTASALALLVRSLV